MLDDFVRQITRRHFFSRTAVGLGSAALAHLLAPNAAQASAAPSGVMTEFHQQLTYKHQGRRYRLTDVHGLVVKDLCA